MPSALLNEIRREMAARGRSRYRIAQESGIAQSQLSRLAAGKRGLSLETAERLAVYFGFDVVLVRRRKRR